MHRTFSAIARKPRDPSTVPQIVATALSYLHAAGQPAAMRQLAGVTVRLGKAGEFPAFRNLAYCTDKTPPEITFAPKIATRSFENVLAVTAHELAHAYLMINGAEHSERQCDSVAELLFDCTIRYDDRDVQTFAQGRRPRPKHLG